MKDKDQEIKRLKERIKKLVIPSLAEVIDRIEFEKQMSLLAKDCETINKVLFDPRLKPVYFSRDSDESRKDSNPR